MRWLLGTFGWFLIGLLVFWLTCGRPELPQTLMSGAMMALGASVIGIFQNGLTLLSGTSVSYEAGRGSAQRVDHSSLLSLSLFGVKAAGGVALAGAVLIRAGFITAPAWL
jgi:hypothetical protein